MVKGHMDMLFKEYQFKITSHLKSDKPKTFLTEVKLILQHQYFIPFSRDRTATT